MAAQIIINLDDIEARVKNLKRIDKTLLDSGLATKRHLVRNWLNGKGGDEKSMKTLTKNYADKKKLGNRKPTLNLTGLMQLSLFAKKLSKTSVIVTFRNFKRPTKGKSSGPQNRDVARGNQKTRPNMMDLSNRFTTKITNFVLKQLQRK